MNLNSKAIGLSLGILAGGIWLVLMAFSFLTGVGVRTLSTLGGYHPFFSYSWGGAVMMGLEHLVGGFVIGWLFTKLHNYFLD